MSNSALSSNLENALTPISDMFFDAILWAIPIIMLLVVIKILVVHWAQDDTPPPRKVAKPTNVLNDFPVSALSDPPTDGVDEIQVKTVANANARSTIDLHKTHSDQ